MITEEQIVELGKYLEIELGEDAQFVLFVMQKPDDGPGTHYSGAASATDSTVHNLVEWINERYIKQIPPPGSNRPPSPGWNTKTIP